MFRRITWSTEKGYFGGKQYTNPRAKFSKKQKLKVRKTVTQSLEKRGKKHIYSDGVSKYNKL
jgi:hypothetical protein